MGRTNYSKMSTQKIKEQNDEPVAVDVEVDDGCASCAINLDELTTKTGNVRNCTKLNVREKPSKDSKILEVLEIGDDVTVDAKSLNKPWYKVTTANGTKGYCMKEYIEII